jgi:tRNA (guanine26-N2/guanine27-N2)-dimethyltransferase
MLVLTDGVARVEADFSRHPRSVSAAANVKLVRYQQNPLPNWGPGKRPEKRKHAEGGNDNGA